MTDKGVSGFSGEHLVKSKLAEFIQLAKQGKIKRGSVLIVESLDRLSRLQVPTALRLFLEILDYGVEIVTLLEPEEWFKVESLSEVQLIIAIVILSRAYNESAAKSHRLKAKWIEKRRQMTDEGKKLTGRTPSWIVKVGNEFEFHHSNESIVRNIVRLYLEGVGVVSIGRRLNQQKVTPLGVGNQKAKMWQKSTILKILRNRALIGEFQPHLGRKNQDQSKRTPVGEPILNYFPPLISEAEFYQIQKRLTERKVGGRTGNGAGSVSNLFTGLIFDARDGSSMNIVHKGSKSGGKQIVSSAARHGNGLYVSFNYDAFETTMLQMIKNISTQDILPQKCDEESNTVDEFIAKIGRLKDRITKIQVQLGDDLNENGLVTTLMPVLAELTKKKRLLEDQLETVKTKLHSSAPTPEDCYELADILQTDNPNLDTYRRRFRQVLRDIVERIDVLALKNGHWRQCFARVLFQNGRTRIMVANLHLSRMVSFGGFDGEYELTTTSCQEHLQKRLGEIKVRSVTKTESNLSDQLIRAAVLKPGVVTIAEDSISLEDRSQTAKVEAT